MKKIMNVEQATTFLQLCQSDDAEFQEAVDMLRATLAASRSESRRLRKEIRDLEKTELRKYKAREKYRDNKISALEHDIEGAQECLRGDR